MNLLKLTFLAFAFLIVASHCKAQNGPPAFDPLNPPSSIPCPCGGTWVLTNTTDVSTYRSYPDQRLEFSDGNALFPEWSGWASASYKDLSGPGASSAWYICTFKKPGVSDPTVASTLPYRSYGISVGWVTAGQQAPAANAKLKITCMQAFWVNYFVDIPHQIMPNYYTFMPIFTNNILPTAIKELEYAYQP